MVAQIAEGVAVIDQVITKSWWFSPFGDWTLSAPHNKSVMQSCEMNLVQKFTSEQVIATREAALELRDALRRDRDPIASEILEGDLGKILDSVIDDSAFLPIENIPYFSKMTRDYLPSVEVEYFNFYSLATYGEPANV
jgi:hypothetical protein